MARRTMVPTLTKAAKEMCRVIIAANPIIRRLFPDNVALHAALDAALAACQLLHDELIPVRDIGD